MVSKGSTKQTESKGRVLVLVGLVALLLGVTVWIRTRGDSGSDAANLAPDEGPAPGVGGGDPARPGHAQPAEPQSPAGSPEDTQG